MCLYNCLLVEKTESLRWIVQNVRMSSSDEMVMVPLIVVRNVVECGWNLLRYRVFRTNKF